MASKFHNIPQKNTVIVTENGNWTISEPAPRQDFPEDYLVIYSEFPDDTFVVSSSAIYKLSKITGSSISREELAVLIAKINIDRICCGFTECEISYTEDFTQYESICGEVTTDTDSDSNVNEYVTQHESICAEYIGDNDENANDNSYSTTKEPMEYIESAIPILGVNHEIIPYGKIEENDIVEGMQLLLQTKTFSFDEIYGYFSELKPDEIATVILARNPYKVLINYI